MSLMNAIGVLARQATDQTKESGKHYYRCGAVKIEAGDDREVRATILGKQPRTVHLTREGGQVQSPQSG